MTDKKKSSNKNSRKKHKDKEEVCEIFDIEKSGKEKIVEACGCVESEEKPTKEQIKKENKIFIQLISVIVAIALIFFISFYVINSAKKFEYKGLKFDVLNEGNVIFYHTSFKANIGGKTVDYNVFLRKDPRKLDKIPLNGTLRIKEMTAINITGDLNCNGDGVIAIANMRQILNAAGGEVVNDKNATCDSLGRYTFLQIQESDKNSIEQTGQTCYTLNVNNCDILEVTERLIVRMLVNGYGNPD